MPTWALGLLPRSRAARLTLLARVMKTRQAWSDAGRSDQTPTDGQRGKIVLDAKRGRGAAAVSEHLTGDAVVVAEDMGGEVGAMLVERAGVAVGADFGDRLAEIGGQLVLRDHAMALIPGAAGRRSLYVLTHDYCEWNRYKLTIVKMPATVSQVRPWMLRGPRIRAAAKSTAAIPARMYLANITPLR